MHLAGSFPTFIMGTLPHASRAEQIPDPTPDPVREPSPPSPTAKMSPDITEVPLEALVFQAENPVACELVPCAPR